MVTEFLSNQDAYSPDLVKSYRLGVLLRALTVVNLVPNNTAYNTSDSNFRESGAFSRLCTATHTCTSPRHIHIIKILKI